MLAATCDLAVGVGDSSRSSSDPPSISLQIQKQHALPQLQSVDEARIRVRACCMDEADIRVRTQCTGQMQAAYDPIDSQLTLARSVSSS